VHQKCSPIRLPEGSSSLLLDSDADPGPKQVKAWLSAPSDKREGRTPRCKPTRQKYEHRPQHQSVTELNFTAQTLHHVSVSEAETSKPQPPELGPTGARQDHRKSEGRRAYHGPKELGRQECQRGPVSPSTRTHPSENIRHRATPQDQGSQQTRCPRHQDLEEGLWELNFKVLYASVEKALGCVARGGFEDDDYYDDDYSGYERQENLRPKIYPDYDVRLDQLVLERVVELDGSACGNRVPVRDSELVQESPFTYESARIRTDFEDNYVTTNDLLLHQ
jgi:hypothetical protein